jgi:hypothetical protein
VVQRKGGDASMSGGFFEYRDSYLEDIAKVLRLEIAKCRQRPDWTDDWSTSSDAFIEEMSKAYNLLIEAHVRLHRLDWVLSGDDGEDTYFHKLPGDLAALEFDDPAKDETWLAEEKERIEEWKQE